MASTAAVRKVLTSLSLSSATLGSAFVLSKHHSFHDDSSHRSPPSDQSSSTSSSNVDTKIHANAHVVHCDAPLRTVTSVHSSASSSLSDEASEKERESNPLRKRVILQKRVSDLAFLSCLYILYTYIELSCFFFEFASSTLAPLSSLATFT